MQIRGKQKETKLSLRVFDVLLPFKSQSKSAIKHFPQWMEITEFMSTDYSNPILLQTSWIKGNATTWGSLKHFYTIDWFHDKKFRRAQFFIMILRYTDYLVEVIPKVPV